MSKLKIFFIFIIASVLLTIRFYFFYQNQPDYKDGQYINFQTTLYSEPKIFGNYQVLSANLGTIDKILIRTNLYPKFHYQDSLGISGKLTFKMLGNSQTLTIMYFPKIEILKKDKNFLLAFANSIRQKIILLFSKTLPEPSSSLILGVAFGIKDLPKDFENNLRISGVLHVVAASGMNISMTGAFFSSIFAFFLRRQIAILATILVIIFYAFLAGLEPSIIRASIMGVIVFASQILGKQNLGTFGLFLAGFIMLYFNPLLIFDVGFQLSFLATFGLLYLRPIFAQNKKVEKIIKRSIIGEDITTTIIAQFATLPILLSNFGAYSIWSIVANGLVLWTVLPLMVIGAIAAIFGIIMEPVGKAILYLSIPLSLYFQKVVEVFGQTKVIIRLDQFPWQLAFGYYTLFIALITGFRRKQSMQ